MSSIEQTIYRMIDFESLIKVDSIKREEDLIDFEIVIEGKEISKEIYREEVQPQDDYDKYCCKCLTLNIRHSKHLVCPKTPNQLKKKSAKKLKKRKPVEILRFMCTQCDQGFSTEIKLRNHKLKCHDYNPSIESFSRINENLHKELNKKYTTQLAVKEELKLNIPTRTNLRTYTRIRPISFHIKEEPEFIVPD